MERLPVFAIERHRLTTDGEGVSTLVGAYGCPLQCKYCLNPHAWNSDTLQKCVHLTPQELYDRVRVDHLYFLATGGGVTFGGGEALLHAEFLKKFRSCCPEEWCLTVETSLNVSREQLEMALEVVDAFIVDIKDMNPVIYESYTGQKNHGVIRNLKRLAEALPRKRVRVRVPQIPDYNTTEDVRVSVEKLKEMGFIDIEVFPYVLRRGKVSENLYKGE